MEPHQMKYQFTQKAKDKKKETIQKMEKHLDATHWLFHEHEQLCQDEVHLLEPLLEIQDEILPLFEPELPTQTISIKLMTKYYEEWETIYIKHGWEKVKPSFRPMFRAELENSWLPYKKGKKIASYLTETSHISRMNQAKSCFKQSGWTLKLFKDASFNLNLLELHDALYTHEAFLILRGISPDDIEYRQIVTWMVGYNPDDEGETFYEAYPEWRAIERQFKNRIKGVVVTGRTEGWLGLKETENEQWITPSELDKQEFIEWALPLGYIEPRQAEFYRDTKYSPYDESFSMLLYDELKKARLIEGEHNEEWRWKGADKSLHWLCVDLHRHEIPKSCHIDKVKDPVWDDFEHYFYYPKDKTPLKKQRPTVLVEGGESVPLDVPKQRTMEKIVEKLLILEGITSGRKEFD